MMGLDCQLFPNCHSWTSSVHITYEFVRNAHCYIQDLLNQQVWGGSQKYVFLEPLDDSDTHPGLRTIRLDDL